MDKPVIFRYLVVLALAVVGISGCSSTDIEQGDPQTPDFILPDLDGEPFQLSSTEGNVVMLHFFAPWCTVCQSEAPAINELYDTYSNRAFKLVSVVVAANSVTEIETFVAQYEVEYPVLIDDQRVSTAYGVRTVPKTFFLDHTGRIDRQINGAMSQEDMEAIVEELLDRM